MPGVNDLRERSGSDELLAALDPFIPMLERIDSGLSDESTWGFGVTFGDMRRLRTALTAALAAPRAASTGEADRCVRQAAQSNTSPIASTDPHKIARCVRGCTTDAQYRELVGNIEAALSAVGGVSGITMLPDCMMPDGGEACVGYRVLVAESERQRTALREIVSQCHNLPRSATADRIESLARPSGSTEKE